MSCAGDRAESPILNQMAGAASALFLLDIKGRVLIWRDYRGDVSAAQAERFFTKFIEKEVNSHLSDHLLLHLDSFRIENLAEIRLNLNFDFRAISSRKIQWCMTMESATCSYSTTIST